MAFTRRDEKAGLLKDLQRIREFDSTSYSTFPKLGHCAGAVAGVMVVGVSESL
jgi:hypothetical protein